MSLLKVELKNRIFILPCFFAFLFVIVYFSHTDQYNNLLLHFEILYTFFPVVCCSLIYNSKDEIDLVISSKSNTYKCFFSKILSIYLLSVLPLVIFFFVFSIFFEITFLQIIYCILSYLITSLLFISLASFCRLIFKNAYAPIVIIFVFILKLVINHDGFVKGYLSKEYIFFDPYLSGYVMAIKEWYLNKLILFFISFIFLIISFIILKKDKLYSKKTI